MSDLRDMGESNAILGRRNWVSRDVLLAAEAIYKGKSECAGGAASEIAEGQKARSRAIKRSPSERGDQEAIFPSAEREM